MLLANWISLVLGLAVFTILFGVIHVITPSNHDNVDAAPGE